MKYLVSLFLLCLCWGKERNTVIDGKILMWYRVMERIIEVIYGKRMER